MKEAKKAVENLLKEVYRDPLSPLAEKQALLARRITMKFNIKQPYELKLLFCKKCKSYSPPVFKKTIRVRKGKLVFTCMVCGSKYRLIFKPKGKANV
ncbi:MAG: RNase P subunit [Nitrososphaeria archaeon]